jgi:hypothetical protein
LNPKNQEKGDSDGILNDKPIHNQVVKTFPYATDAEVDMGAHGSQELMNYTTITGARVGEVA